MGSSTPLDLTSAAEKSQGSVSSSQGKGGKWSLKKKIALGVVLAIVIIGLAVGLGVGLTVGRNGSDEDDGDGNGGNNNGNDNGGNDNNSNNNNKTIWRPEVGASWQITLIKPMDVKTDLIPGVDIYDIDLFDNEKSTFDALHDQKKKVICYFSAGSYEDWRDDAGDFEKSDLGKPLDGWPGERWLKLSSENVRSIMTKRIKYAAEKGCDAIDPDNVDGYQNDNGLGLQESDSVSYMTFLSQQAQSFNMSIGLKNAGDIIPDVLPHVHFSVNEQCVEYSECETFAAFIKDNKPVFNIEYPKEWKAASVNQQICSEKGKAQGTEGFSIVIKDMDLDKKVEYCDGKTYS
ncbi:hypothetical protein NLU13_6549 [Sarocladium strictum]|uniref:alpha-galactosidase n=1 Tax=Sarocladium strictum TaxID=5046 RepID=A0AA39GGU9_SARSR|nr:hypothetical protein NLU13_6549 [Sarocladium strictum]